MPNINDGININVISGIIIFISWWADTQKAAVRARKAMDNRTRRLLRRGVGLASITDTDILDQIAEPLRTAYRTALLVCFGQCLKNPYI